MRCLLIWLVFCAVAWPQTVASRRYAEKTIAQYSFGPLTPIAPYNIAAAGNVTDAAIQPSHGVLDNNTFASTGNFTVIRKDDATTAFSVSGNVGTIVTGSAASQTYVIGSTASDSLVTDTNCFIQVEIDAATASGTNIMALGLTNAADTLEINAQVNWTANNVIIHVLSGGTDHTLAGPSTFPVRPTAPWKLGFSLINQWVSAWYNTGSGWVLINAGSISTNYDPRTSGLSGLKSSIKIFTSQVTTWQFSNLKMSVSGGIGLRDISLVTYPDGRPYMQGSVAYLFGTVAGPTVTGTPNSAGNGIFSYDVNTGTLSWLGTLGVSRNSGVFQDQAGQIIYDPANNTERLFIGNWGTASGTSSVVTFYASQSITTDDWLSASVTQHTTPAATQMTFPGSVDPYDTNAACTQWNYSAGTCGNWQASFINGTNGPIKAVSSTSDPSANTWTSLFNTSNSGYEGTRINRTATTYLGNGVAYPTDGGASVGAGTNVRLGTAYNQAGTSLGNINWQPPAGHYNPPHVPIFSYGNTEYLISFSDTTPASFGPANLTAAMGNLTVSTAPKYSAATNWPQLINSGSAFTSSSVSSVAVSAGDYAGTFTLAAGDLVIGFVRMLSTSPTAPTFTDGLSNSYTCGAMNTVTATGTDFACWGFVTNAGTATFTGGWTTAAANDGILVMQIRPGFVTTNDVAITYSNSLAAATQGYTSGTFSTSAAGLVVVCGDAQVSADIQEGTIGPYQASFGVSNVTSATACMATATTGAQASITGNMGIATGSTAKWGGLFMAFK